VLVVLGCLVARPIYLLAGVRFNSTPLGFYIQYVDPLLLRERLVESLLHLRDQPPLFNAYLGVVLKLFGSHADLAFAASFLLAGVALGATVFRLLERLGVSTWLAALITLTWVDGPVFILYENWLFYMLPVALLLALGALWLHRYLTTRRTRDAFGFFLILAVASLTNGMFHPVWVVSVIGLLIALERGHRRRLARAALLPLALLGGLMLKNVLVYGEPSTGRFMRQYDLAVVTVQRVPLPVRKKLVAQGKLSPVSVLPFDTPYFHPERYESIVPRPPPSGIPLLDDPRKSTGWGDGKYRAVNWHQQYFLTVGELYQSDTAYVLRHLPGGYLKQVGTNIGAYFNPSDECDGLERDRPNAKELKRALEVYDLVLAGQTAVGRPAYLHLLILPALFAFALFRVWKQRRALLARAGVSRRHTEAIVLLFILGNITWCLVLAVAISFGDQSRYRYLVTALYLVLLGLAAERAKRWVTVWRRRRSRRLALAKFDSPANLR